MSAAGWGEVFIYLLALVLLVKPLGQYLARVAEGEVRGLAWLERACLRVIGTRGEEQSAWEYGLAWLWLQGWGIVVLLVILLTQNWHPWNPQGFAAVPWHTALNIAVSFVTNTNWQNYGGETTLSYFSQMSGLGVQNFVSAASGLVLVAVLARAFRNQRQTALGNFWVDLVRCVIYVLLPLSLLLSVCLLGQGVIMNLAPYATTASGQVLPMGPAASQIAIKQLGTNGGGFFNVNSAHPFENPTPLSNFLQALSILAIPAACCYMFGSLIRDKRQGWALLAVMLLIFVPLLVLTCVSESSSAWSAQPNLEGKEVRLGVADSAIWAAATTAASNGSVNSMHDSYMPLGQMTTMFLMMLGEVVFGGVGSGLYGMVVFAMIGVFIAGLMVGRTPEYLGKKIEATEMKMASLAILAPPLCVLLGAGVAICFPDGRGVQDHGAHGFSEILYAFTSMGNNNGSAFGGYTANTPLVNYLGAIAMLVSRLGVALPVVAIAGSLSQKKIVPQGPGTLATHSPLFVGFLAVTVVVVGALAFLPALALGPVVEWLQVVR